MLANSFPPRWSTVLHRFGLAIVTDSAEKNATLRADLQKPTTVVGHRFDSMVRASTIDDSDVNQTFN